MPCRSTSGVASRLPGWVRRTSDSPEQKGHKKEEILGKVKFKIGTYQPWHADAPRLASRMRRAVRDVLHLLSTAKVGRHGRKKKARKKARL